MFTSSAIWTQELTLPKPASTILTGFVQRTISIHILLQIFSPPIISAGFFCNSGNFSIETVYWDMFKVLLQQSYTLF